jgi:hypothetical protein
MAEAGCLRDLKVQNLDATTVNFITPSAFSQVLSTTVTVAGINAGTLAAGVGTPTQSNTASVAIIQPANTYIKSIYVRNVTVAGGVPAAVAILPVGGTVTSVTLQVGVGVTAPTRGAGNETFNIFGALADTTTSAIANGNLMLPAGTAVTWPANAVGFVLNNSVAAAGGTLPGATSSAGTVGAGALFSATNRSLFVQIFNTSGTAGNGVGPVNAAAGVAIPTATWRVYFDFQSV